VSAASRARAAVVVVHGLWMPGTETVLIRRRLARAGFDTFLFRYRSVSRSLRENARRLAEFVASIPNDTVHFVGHSLGGVLVLSMLATEGVARPGRVVCMGSPLCGTAVGARLAHYRLGRWIDGRSICELIDCGGLPAWQGRHDVGVLAGSRGIGIGRLLGGLSGPNDGLIAVAETALPGATDHLVIPVAHTEFLWSRLAMRQIVAFLRNGRFDRTAGGAR
jgi:pimeloyl-ACP methyl ester carboxylesterase